MSASSRIRPLAAPSPIGSWLFVTLQRAIPQHLLSRAMHRLARARCAPLKRALVSSFVRAFHPRMDEAAEPDARRYGSFNELFTRALRAGARRIDPDPRNVVSPVDGTVSEIGHLDGLALVQAKGRAYRLDALLADGAAAERFAGGAFATLYLAPADYHRIHMPSAGELTWARYVPGRLFSVNAATAAAVSGLFARNERVVCAFETEERVPFAMVLVGALLVGSIATRWHGEVTPAKSRRPRELSVPAASSRLEKGAEMGRFNMGSTVILLFPRGALSWRSELAAGSVVRVGQPLARLGAVGEAPLGAAENAHGGTAG